MPTPHATPQRTRWRRRCRPCALALPNARHRHRGTAPRRSFGANRAAASSPRRSAVHLGVGRRAAAAGRLHDAGVGDALDAAERADRAGHLAREGERLCCARRAGRGRSGGCITGAVNECVSGVLVDRVGGWSERREACTGGDHVATTLLAPAACVARAGLEQAGPARAPPPG